MIDDTIAPIANAMADPEMRDRLETIVGAMRSGLAPVLNADIDNLELNQSIIISGAALLAGMTLGHMTFLGALKPRDQRRAERLLLKNFRNGISYGLEEARRTVASAGKVQ